MSGSDIPLLKRPSFFAGQRLTADDLAVVHVYHRELRWLHNRSLHNWGIAFGYAVRGAREDRVVHVEPGYALDCQGRDLILTEALELPIPAISGDAEGNPVTYYLTVSYADDADLVAQTRNGDCGTSGAVRYPEMPLIRWQRPGDFEFGIDVVLITISVQNCRLAADVSLSERRDALPPTQPYVASGETSASTTAWRLWPDDAAPVGVATTVSTADAGFRTTPQYQAHVMGARVLDTSSFATGGFNTNAIVINQPNKVVIEGYPQVHAATATGFDLIVILPNGGIPTGGAIMNPPAILTPDFVDYFRTELNWRVVWTGTEG